MTQSNIFNSFSGDTINEHSLQLDFLMPNMRKVDKADRIFIYDGSLSTPGCYESVVWIVYASHPFVSGKQVIGSIYYYKT